MLLETLIGSEGKNVFWVNLCQVNTHDDAITLLGERYFSNTERDIGEGHVVVGRWNLRDLLV